MEKLKIGKGKEPNRPDAESIKDIVNLYVSLESGEKEGYIEAFNNIIEEYTKILSTIDLTPVFLKKLDGDIVSIQKEIEKDETGLSADIQKKLEEIHKQIQERVGLNTEESVETVVEPEIPVEEPSPEEQKNVSAEKSGLELNTEDQKKEEDIEYKNIGESDNFSKAELSILKYKNNDLFSEYTNTLKGYNKLIYLDGYKNSIEKSLKKLNEKTEEVKEWLKTNINEKQKKLPLFVEKRLFDNFTNLAYEEFTKDFPVNSYLDLDGYIVLPTGETTGIKPSFLTYKSLNDFGTNTEKLIKEAFKTKVEMYDQRLKQIDSEVNKKPEIKTDSEYMLDYTQGVNPELFKDVKNIKPEPSEPETEPAAEKEISPKPSTEETTESTPNKTEEDLKSKKEFMDWFDFIKETIKTKESNPSKYDASPEDYYKVYTACEPYLKKLDEIHKDVLSQESPESEKIISEEALKLIKYELFTADPEQNDIITAEINALYKKFLSLQEKNKEIKLPKEKEKLLMEIGNKNNRKEFVPISDIEEALGEQEKNFADFISFLDNMSENTHKYHEGHESDASNGYNFLKNYLYDTSKGFKKAKVFFVGGNTHDYEIFRHILKDLRENKLISPKKDNQEAIERMNDFIEKAKIYKEKLFSKERDIPLKDEKDQEDYEIFKNMYSNFITYSYLKTDAKEETDKKIERLQSNRRIGRLSDDDKEKSIVENVFKENKLIDEETYNKIEIVAKEKVQIAEFEDLYKDLDKSLSIEKKTYAQKKDLKKQINTFNTIKNSLYTSETAIALTKAKIEILEEKIYKDKLKNTENIQSQNTIYNEIIKSNILPIKIKTEFLNKYIKDLTNETEKVNISIEDKIVFEQMIAVYKQQIEAWTKTQK